jgi:Rrf2 family protein
MVDSQAIASKFNVSEAHLSKVMQRLVKVGLVRSIRGPRGGFSLTRAPGQVRLLEVFEAIEGPVEALGCLFAAPQCDGKECILGSFLLEANQALLKRLSRTTLKETSRVLLKRGIVSLPGAGEEAGAGRGKGRKKRVPAGKRRRRGRST